MNWDHEFCISDAFGVLIILAPNVLIFGPVLAGLSTAELYNCWQLATFLQWRFNFCTVLFVIRKQLCSNRLESLQGWIILVVKIPNKSCLPAGELIYVASLLLPVTSTLSKLHWALGGGGEATTILRNNSHQGPVTPIHYWHRRSILIVN